MGDRDVRVVIADDHRVVRAGLLRLIAQERGLTVVGEAGDVAEAERCVAEHAPDVLVLDLSMPGEPGLDAIPRLAAAHPDTAIVVLTMHDAPAFARAALRRGAHAYVLKDAAGDELVTAVRRAAAGRRYLDPLARLTCSVVVLGGMGDRVWRRQGTSRTLPSHPETVHRAQPAD
jgi:DNA-binding NarL/FixJ family response regulator